MRTSEELIILQKRQSLRDKLLTLKSLEVLPISVYRDVYGEIKHCNELLKALKESSEFNFSRRFNEFN